MQLHFGHRTPVHDIHHIEADILPSPIHRTFPCQAEVQHEHESLKEERTSAAVQRSSPGDESYLKMRVECCLARDCSRTYRGDFLRAAGCRIGAGGPKNKFLPICVISPAFLPENPT